MTRDDIIRLARESGLYLATDVHWMPIIGFEYAEKFAALVATAERESCAKVCESRYMGDNNREDQEAKRCAAAIRARGQA